MALLDEIRRRNVHRVALGYLAGAWLVVQIVETLFPMFGISDAGARAVVIVIAVGFVPALVLSWIFEWTPAGIVRDNRADTASRAPTKVIDRAITLTLLLAVGYFSIDKFVFDPARDRARIAAATEEARSAAFVESFGDKSIAVMPFLNMSSDPEQEYFSDGISEELLNLLARIPELRVISRSTSFTFKGKNVSAPEAASRMKVAHILEGSVRKSGDAVRVTVQLIDARSDTHLWSETYDRKLADIFAIQDEISAEIVSQLKLKLLNGPPRAEAIDPAAYTLYLQAREIIHNNRYGREDVAHQKLEEVLKAEPEFVPAIWELARVEHDREKFEALIARLVQIAPDSSYTNGWLAFLAENDEADFQKAAYYYERAVADMSDWNGYFQLGLVSRFLAKIQRFDEAYELAMYLIRRDPACQWCVARAAQSLRYMDRQQEGAHLMESILDWADPGPDFYWDLGVSWLVAGDAAKALHYFDLMGDPPGDNLGRLMAQYSLGRREEFDAEFEIFRNNPETNPESIARVYAWTGQNDLAFEWLERMVQREGPASVGYVQTDLYARLMADSRWQPFLARHGYVEPDYSTIEFNPILPEEVRKALESKGRATE